MTRNDLLRQSAPSRGTSHTPSLASIPSSGSLSSNPETLKPSSKKVNGRNSGLPQRTSSLQSKTRHCGVIALKLIFHILILKFENDLQDKNHDANYLYQKLILLLKI